MDDEFDMQQLQMGLKSTVDKCAEYAPGPCSGGRNSLASFRVIYRVMDRTFRELDVDVSSTNAKRFANVSVENP